MESIKTGKEFYIMSSEGYHLEEPHTFRVLEERTGSDQGAVLKIKIVPALNGEYYNCSGELEVVYLMLRFRSDSFENVEKWPIDVRVYRSLNSDLPFVDMQISDFEPIAWAEVYRSEQQVKMTQKMHDGKITVAQWQKEMAAN